uniref:Uncharacterized protein n=1 Tax=Amphimedon queenslandica TaxID=400682 RepID=A0A1X7ST82_AMPQE
LPAFECTRKGDSQVLFQARFCFTTDLEAVDCDMDWFASIQPCDDSIVVNYL